MARNRVIARQSFTSAWLAPHGRRWVHAFCLVRHRIYPRIGCQHGFYMHIYQCYLKNSAIFGHCKQKTSLEIVWKKWGLAHFFEGGGRGCCGRTGTPPVINNLLLIRVIELVKSWKKLHIQNNMRILETFHTGRASGMRSPACVCFKSPKIQSKKRKKCNNTYNFRPILIGFVLYCVF